jgi:DNA-binding HxlR family transcriptional regulator
VPRKLANKSYSCPVEVTLGVVGGKWKSLILYYLIDRKILRFGEIRRLVPAATAQMLTAQLRELEADGVINRKVYAQVPPKVEYSLTSVGKSLAPIVSAMTSWGADYAQTTGRRLALVKNGARSNSDGRQSSNR